MRRKKLLLVDDSTVIQTLSNKIFFGLGIEVIGEKKGAHVVDIILNNDIDVVVLDIILPDSNGMEIAAEIRKLKNKAKATIPIIIISGNYDNYTEEDFNRLDISDYLIKPLDYDNLVQRVNKYCR